jgi:uncharacterized membrane protein YkvA (DUF1232 family)
MTRRLSPSTASTNSTQQGFSEDALWKKIAKLPARASSKLIYEALILYCVLSDRSTPAWVRALIAAALIYVINPFDAVPDAIPGLGLADDAAAVALLLQRIASYVTPAIERRASKLVPWNKASGDSKAPPINNKTQRNAKGKQDETLS